MKIPNNDRNINSSSTARNLDRRPAFDSDDSKKSNFAKTLERKREERDEPDAEDRVDSGGSKDEPESTNDANVPYRYSQDRMEAFSRLNPEAGGAASETAGAHASVAALASEIVEQIRVEIAPGDMTAIEIDFNSKTLEGLKVRIESKDGILGVHFTPPSEKVASLLSQNLATLNQNLTNQGYQVGVIDLKPVQEPHSDFQQRGHDRDGGEGGGRGRQGDREDSDGRGDDGSGGGQQQGGYER